MFFLLAIKWATRIQVDHIKKNTTLQEQQNMY
jgi:hypothetical protein